jgi:hypothetical protein
MAVFKTCTIREAPGLAAEAARAEASLIEIATAKTELLQRGASPATQRIMRTCCGALDFTPIASMATAVRVK